MFNVMDEGIRGMFDVMISGTCFWRLLVDLSIFISLFI